MLAVIKTGGKQYTVKEKQTLRIEKLPAGSRTGKTVTFTDVLLVSPDEKSVTVGKPTIAKARVEATVVADGKSRKAEVVKYKPKVRYKRTRGHRQPYTEVRIEKIITG